MSNQKKNPLKDSKIKVTKNVRRSSDVADAPKSIKSNQNSKSILKMASKSYRITKTQVEPNVLNESTYGALPETKAFSTSAYKKGQQHVSKIVDASNREVKDTLQTHATYYLITKGFRVLDKIGSGNYAKVYRVINPENREIAVKIIDLAKTSSNYRLKFLPRELDILSRLSHRNIARVFEIIQLPKLIYIFMEYTPNGTVADFLRVYRAIPENFCQCMFVRIVDAICYLHKVFIAHRDLKLENILIDKYGQPKLTDFSYSLICKVEKSSNKVHLSRTFCGSLPYIAPEILSELPYDPKVADIWSLGVCLFVMLNDGIPFKFADIPSMLQSQLTRNWKFKNRVAACLSDEVKDLVRLMLEPDVKLRIDAFGVQTHRWCSVKPQ